MSFLKQFLITAFVLVGANFAIGWHIGALDGDLTRLGKLAEKDYLARAAPQRFHRFVTPDAQPTVLVLGDSLSTGNVWPSQARRLRPELKFVIFPWHAIGFPGCLNAWLDTTLAIYPSVEHVVIQTGEVNYFERLNYPQKPCKAAPINPVRLPAEEVTDARDPTLNEIMPDPLYGLAAFVDSVGSGLESGKTYRAEVRRLTTPKLFSNHRSDRLVSFIRDTEFLGTSREEMLSLAANAAAVGRHVSDMKRSFTFMLVPSKTTVYHDALVAAPVRTAGITPWEALDALCVPQIRLDASMAAGAASTVDFFRPNDTHPSIRGYETIAKGWLESLPAARLRSERLLRTNSRCSPA